jgi:hypothetical protein
MNQEPPNPRPGWEPLPPDHLPGPTVYPIGLAMGTTFIFWGLISSLMILGAGLVLFGLTLAGWISDIRHERKPH